ncbi:putative eka-like protein [Golovinomyces cichoracearum]|uniref:Putative eka-like protein n=1 Tax=Golovinomyces cichoracearum TaxID=62708 RepID=A0A420J9S0_9PEZI|nr:putative eka-like protein [Golovinomyces cichoracearum]
MKQRRRQSFNDFFQQFEFMLALCGGLHSDSQLKVSRLINGLNETLEKALIGIDLPPDDDYAQWVSKVRDVAGRLEYHQKRNFIKSGKEIYRLAFLTNQNSLIDADGDTIMTGVNALLTLINNNDQSSKGNLSLASLGKNNNFRQKNNGKDARLRAPWRSQDEFQKLLSLGVCVRCDKTGNYSKICPTFRAAICQRVNISSSRVEVEEEYSGKDCP